VIFISHVSIVVPFVLGAAAGWWLWPRYASPGVSSISFMLFLGVAMSVTAFPVLARILVENGLLASPVGRLAMACAAIDDLTAWCLLALVVTISRARHPLEALWTAGLAVCFCVLMRYAVRPVLIRMDRFVKSPGDLTPGVMAAALLLILACSVLTELIGVHALFGAFILGLVVPKRGDLARGLVEKLETVTVVLLLPLFFAYSGLRTQIGQLNQPEHWWVTLALIAIATLGKAGAGAVAARMMGFAWREARAVGVLMNTRGLVELVVLNAGMDLGILSPTVFTMLVIMALVTTFATTPLLRRLYPRSERGPLGLMGRAGAHSR
jgi:Kef-type K+ transport system membrane component KefB